MKQIVSDFYLQKSADNFFAQKREVAKFFSFFSRLRTNFWQTGTSRRNRDINFPCPLFRFLTVAGA